MIDSRMLSNFPVLGVRRSPAPSPGWPTFGLLLVEPEPTEHLGSAIVPPTKSTASAR